MVYFCLIENGGPTASHLEVLDAECPLTATTEAKRLLTRHTSAVMAHVIHGEETVASISVETGGSD